MKRGFRGSRRGLKKCRMKEMAKVGFKLCAF
jgi:hypothetical protein